nr:GerAB/ArcD/ProY family transporter [Bacillus methanolicus]
MRLFSEEMIRRTIWPTFQMWRVAELPFVERLEYIGMALDYSAEYMFSNLDFKQVNKTNSPSQTKDQRASYRNPLFNHLCFFSDERRN